MDTLTNILIGLALAMLAISCTELYSPFMPRTVFFWTIITWVALFLRIKEVRRR